MCFVTVSFVPVTDFTGHMIKSTRLPNGAAGTLNPLCSYDLDHCSHKPPNEQVQMYKDQDQLPFSIPCKQVGRADEYVRAEMWRFRERTQRGWKRSLSCNCMGLQ